MSLGESNLDFLVKKFISNSGDVNNPKVRQAYGVFAGITGIALNIFLFALKLIAGFLTSSIAVFADAFNNIFDAASSTVTLVGFKMAGKPADKQHPFGHGRIEYISGLIVSMIIIMVGVELLVNSAQKIITPLETQLSYVSIAILCVSVCVKIFMACLNRSLGKKISSHTLVATAFDSVCDAIATTVVIASIAIKQLFDLNVDGIAGVVVALFIIYTGIMSAKDTLDSILGESPSEEFVKKIEDRVCMSDEILGVHDLIVHNYGPGRSVVSLHAEVHCDVNLVEIHYVIDEIERGIKHDMNCEVVIHIDPIEVKDERTNEIRGKMEMLVKLIDKNLCIHDFRMQEDDKQSNLLFDVEVPHSFRLSDDEIRESVLIAAKSIDPKFEIVINVDKT